MIVLLPLQAMAQMEYSIPLTEINAPTFTFFLHSYQLKTLHYGLNSRFREMYDQPTYFFRQGILKPWHEILLN